MDLRKSVAVTIAAVLSLSLTACSGTGGSSDGQGTKITVWSSKVEMVDDLKALAQEYNDNEGGNVEVWGTTGDDYPTQLKTRLPNRATGPSVFTTAGGNEADTLVSYMVDLSSAPFADDIAEGQAYENSGKVLGLPAAVEGYGLIVNENLVDPATVTTQEGFADMLKQADSSGEYTGFELSQEAYFLIGHMLNTAFAMQDDPKQFVSDVESGKVKMQDVKEFQELGKVYESIREYSTNPLQVNYDKQIGDLMTGKTASVNQGMWINTMIDSDYQDSDAKLSMIPFPLADNDKLTVGVPIYWHVNSMKSDEEQQAGIDFLNWMVSSETGQDYIVNKFKFIPAMTNIDVDESNMDVLSKKVYESSQAGDNLPWAYQYWPLGIVDTRLVPTTQEFFTDQSVTGQQFITNLNDDFVAAAETV